MLIHYEPFNGQQDRSAIQTMLNADIRGETLLNSPMTTHQPRQPLDNRPLSEQYQFTKADTLIRREQQKDNLKRKLAKRKHWRVSIISTLLILLFLYGINQ